MSGRIGRPLGSSGFFLWGRVPSSCPPFVAWACHSVLRMGRYNSTAFRFSEMEAVPSHLYPCIIRQMDHGAASSELKAIMSALPFLFPFLFRILSTVFYLDLLTAAVS